MTTPLPSHLQKSTKALRGLSPCSEHSYELLNLIAWNIASELEEAAQAQEAQREDRRKVLRILYEAHRKTNPSPSLATINTAIQHLQAVKNASTQITQEGAPGITTNGGRDA